jgi:hypothetical protein
MHISLGNSKYVKGPRDGVSRVNKYATSGASRAEIGNLLHKFKTYILSTLGSDLDTLTIKETIEEYSATLTIYCPKCRKIHPLREYPLDNIELCGMCGKSSYKKISISIRPQSGLPRKS